MVKDLVVTRSIFFHATPERVWEALTHPGMTKHYMFNCEVHSEWKQGSSINWRGNYMGQDVEQTGQILEIIPFRLLKFTTCDPQVGNCDEYENYLNITYELMAKKGMTQLFVTIDNFAGDELRAEQAANTWDMELLPKLQGLVETTL